VKNLGNLFFNCLQSRLVILTAKCQRNKTKRVTLVSSTEMFEQIELIRINELKRHKKSFRLSSFFIPFSTQTALLSFSHPFLSLKKKTSNFSCPAAEEAFLAFSATMMGRFVLGTVTGTEVTYETQHSPYLWYRDINP
jgi:hypothetical protein